MSPIAVGTEMHAVCQRPGCGKPFTYIRTHGRPPAYCSTACREAGHDDTRKAYKRRMSERAARTKR